MDKIVYPIALSYVPNWGPWNIVSELVTNAMDSDKGFKMGLASATDNAGPKLWIESRGNLVERHLLLGISEKPSEDAIGQHGEGLKLAMLVLTRMGLTAHIYTDNAHFWNEPARLNDTDVFAICSDNEKCLNLKPGFTYVVIPDWPHRLYRDRFVTEGDPRVAYCDPFGRFILDEEIPQLYVKGVWVSKAGGYGKSYQFGYNLIDVEMNRDRATVSQWSVNWEIGKIWTSCTNEELLVRFWQAVKDGSAEKDCTLATNNLAKGPHKRAFQTVFGKRAVAETDEALAREAKHIGATVVNQSDVGYSNLGVVSELIGTDLDHLQQLRGAAKVYVPDKKLEDKQLGVLKLLRRLAKRVGFRGKILAYILPKDVLGEQYKDDIRLSLARLDDDKTAVATWLHEEAHRQTGSADTTDEFADAIAQVSAEIIISYARR